MRIAFWVLGLPTTVTAIILIGLIEPLIQPRKDHPMTPTQVADYLRTAPNEDPIQHHDITDEMDTAFQDAIHACAEHCCAPADGPLATA